MDERLERMERLLASSIRLQKSFQEAHEIMQSNLRRNEANWRQIESNQRQIEANLRQIDANQRQIEENNRRIEQDNVLLDAKIQESRELLDQLLQSVAVMQADIVRIDETHAGPSAA